MTDRPRLKLKQALKSYKRRLVVWWRGNDQRWGWKWRAANLATAVVVLASVIAPVATQLYNSGRYELSDAALQLVGKNDSKLASKLKYNAQTKTYEFNKDAVKEFNPIDQLKAQVGTSPNNDKDKSLFALDVPEDMARGVTYHDINSQLSFKLVPQFGGLPGKSKQGYLVYPLANKAQAVYTLKNNGLKEDIVVQKATKDTLEFSYKLDLTKTLEARALDDGSGAIGIYSANPSLFGNISYGSDKDREMVEKARETAEKDTLVFGIPAPVIITADSEKTTTAKARFELKGNTLTVVAEGLKSLTQPFSIDPSVVVTSASEFATDANNEGNIDFGVSNDIKRVGLTGATVGNWTGQTASSACNTQNAGQSTVNNGYVYFITFNTPNTNQVCRAKLTNAGAIDGLWQAGPTTNNVSPASFVYNGYLYALGGMSGTSPQATTYYARISPTDGSVGSWVAGSTMNQTRGNTIAVGGPAVTAYNGYAYVSGGCTNSVTCGAQNTVEYAAINPNGSLGAWQSATNMPEAKTGNMMNAHNGYVYVVGGQTSGAGTQNVYYASINSNGSLGSWIQTSGLTTNAFRYANSIVHNGYMYMVAGHGNGGAVSEIQYAPIYANGSLGSWVTQTGLPLAEMYVVSFVYNNYMFVRFSDNTVYSALINSAGILRPYASAGANFTTGRCEHGYAAYNGYLYIAGGSSNCNGTNTADVQYAPINANGTIGSWTATTSLPNAKAKIGLVAHNGWLYSVGGEISGLATAIVERAPINTNGSIGAWVAGGNNLPDARQGASVHVYAGRIYVVGGIGTGVNTTVDYATIAADGSIGAWTDDSDSPYTTGRWTQGSVIVGNYLYIMGGRDTATNIFSDVQYVPINADGSLGTWAATTSLPGGTPRDGFGAFAYKGHIYISGGCTARNGLFNPCISVLGDTQFIKVNANGTLAGSWTATENFATARCGHKALAYNGYLMMTGGGTGANCGTQQADTQSAQINNDSSGVSGTWTRNGENQGGGNLWNGSAAYGNYVYNVGGCDGAPFLGGRLNCGSASSFVISTPICDGTMSTGGCTSGTANVPGENINTGQPISGARYGLTSVAHNGYLYAIGGCTALNVSGMSSTCSTFGSDVQYAPIASNGTLGSWASDPDAFPTARYGHTSAVYNGYLYIMGGCSAATVGSGGCTTMQSDTQYALICTGNNNGVDGCGATAGQVGTWHSGASFTTARMYHAGVAYGGYLYILGGCTALAASVCNTFTDDVQSIQLNSNGSTSGSWATNRAIQGARFGLAATAYNGYLYMAGGCPTDSANMCSDNSAYNTVDVAAVGANGRLGNWHTSPTRLASRVAAHGLVVGAGNLIEMRGSRGTGVAAQSVGIASLSTIPRKGLYSKLLTFNFSTSPRQITYNGLLSNGTSDIAYRGSSSATSWTGSTTSASSLTNARCPTPASNRYLQLFVALDDTYRGIFPDEPTNAANLTDLTLSYEFSRPPNMRLKLGKILQENLGQTDLDICKLVAQ